MQDSCWEIKINVSEESNWIKLTQMTVGFAAETLIQDLRKQDDIENCQITSFLTNCRIYLISMIHKLFERSPLKKWLTRNVRISDPSVMISLKKILRVKVVLRVYCIIS